MPSRSRGAPKLTTAQKGYDHDHVTNRGRLLRRHVDGRPCWWCGRPMYRDKAKNWDGHALEAHHTKSIARHGTGRNRADKLLHKTCNIQCGDGTHDDKRPTATNHVDVTHTDNGVGNLAMGWPWT